MYLLEKFDVAKVSLHIKLLEMTEIRILSNFPQIIGLKVVLIL